jgi:transcriptional regulator with XRE-family HTH domain
VVVNVKAKATELEVLRAQIAGNATVTKTTNKAFIKGIYKLATSNEAASMEELAKEAGMTVSYLNRLLKALRLDDEILDLAEKSKVSITNIITLAEIAGKVDNEDIIETYLPLAESQTGKEFVATIAEALDGIKAEKTNKPNEFVAKAKLRSMDEIQVKLASATGVEADMLKWVISLDEPTVAQAKADYDKALAERETKKAERKAAREKEKLEEYRSKLEAEGFVVAPQK